MHILIDLQAAQTSSMYRGIGRYSIAFSKAIIRNKKQHKISILLNGAFASSIVQIQKEFSELLTEEDFHIWYPPTPVDFINKENAYQRQAAELIREAVINRINPDFLLIASLFEGLVDDSVNSIRLFSESIPTAVILYDLIPLIYSEKYLTNERNQKWYFNKIDYLKKADLLLAISESSRQEAIKYLEFSDKQVINILGDAEAQFKPIIVSKDFIKKLARHYKITKPFIMYTGGIDHRKNIDRLIAAFAKLPSALRTEYQLAIVCAVKPHEKTELLELANSYGLLNEELIVTGFVPEEDLVAMYNQCSLFIFPSWHEGFGLPILEAMRCGAPVIASNTSSMPEIINNPVALFDPRSVDSITSKITEILENNDLLNELIKHSHEQSKFFSWDDSAVKAIEGFERIEKLKKNQKIKTENKLHPSKPKLAYISPLPPIQSGIANYSADLIPLLNKFYDIDVIVEQALVDSMEVTSVCNIRDVEWFKNNYLSYDRIIYQFGNSEIHNYMLPLVEKIPGVVVLHDFFLSGIQARRETHLGVANAMTDAIYYSHGYKDLSTWHEDLERQELIGRIPCNFQVLENALNIIVHSDYSIELAEDFYQKNILPKFHKIPLLRKAATEDSRVGARKILGIKEDIFLICSFGFIGKTKCNLELLKAFHDLELSDKNIQLIFVGKNDTTDYGEKIQQYINEKKLNEYVQITGWIDDAEMQNYLVAADIAVQLRTYSRGETSAAVLDCLNVGVPTIVNANGSFKELPNETVFMLPDQFTQLDLMHAIEILYNDKGRREKMSKAAKKYIAEQHDPELCAKKYYDIIEASYSACTTIKSQLIQKIAELNPENNNEDALLNIVTALKRNFSHQRAEKQIFIDVSEFVNNSENFKIPTDVILKFINNPTKGFRVEPVYLLNSKQGFLYAREFICGLLEIRHAGLIDRPIEFFAGDVFLSIAQSFQRNVDLKHFYELMKVKGVKLYFINLFSMVYPQLNNMIDQEYSEYFSEDF